MVTLDWMLWENYYNFIIAKVMVVLIAIVFIDTLEWAESEFSFSMFV